MPEALANGIRIAYDDVGDGEPALLFLPGWCVNRGVFSGLVARTREHHRSLALDWRGHGGSAAPQGDFGLEELVRDAAAVIEASRADRVVPVALAHAGWVAIELRRRLGRRIPKLVLLDWIVTEAPPPFLERLRGMQSAGHWKETVDQILTVWLHDIESEELTRFVREEVAAYGYDMWARAARMIEAAYAREHSPLEALARLEPSIPVLHIYAQPAGAEYLTAQQAFGAGHPWFRVRRLKARSHFPMFEVPDDMAEAIRYFVE
jgi:pimeloyl-ACP methyl ester carboxylesterase